MFSINAARTVVCFLAGALMVAGVAPAQTVYYVDDDGRSTACTGWDDACPDLQTALGLAVSGDQIWVAAGTYKPTSGTNRWATFELITGVEIYGGLAGTETTLEERAGLFDQTILSGNVGSPNNHFDNSYHVVTGSGTDGTAVLDGFTITGGNALGAPPPDNRGGGMYNESGSPTVNNCTFSANTASSGGGMYNDSGNPTVTNCTFSGNSAGSHGGGMRNESGSPMVTNCTFRGNSADYDGGAMQNISGSPTVTNCTFSANSADRDGGGMYNWRGSPTVANCTFNANSAEFGAGMYNGTGRPMVANCTFSGNSAEYGGGISDSSACLTMTNCILWANAPDEIYKSSGTAIVTYSVVRDADPDDGVVYPGTGNLDGDPLLSGHGLHLTANSPCRNSGDPDGDYTGQTDMDGESRVIGPQVDMGADEWLDTDEDGLPDFWEERHFGSPTAGDPQADEDGDLLVNLDEYCLGLNPNIASLQFYVDVSGNDAWDGLAPEWDGAHGPKATIQAAIDAAAQDEGDRISAAPGTFNEAIDFVGKAVALRSAGGPEVTVIDATRLEGPVVTCVTGEGPDTVLDGFTITGGSATCGGGMYSSGTSPTVTNCAFSGNSAGAHGGGMYNESGCPTVTNCIFKGNSASAGGGMRNESACPMVANCTFSGNSAHRGGGMYNLGNSSPTVTNCTFNANSAYSCGGAIYNTDNSSPTVTNCILWENVPDEIYDDNGGITTVTFSAVGDGNPGDGIVYPGTGNLDDDPLLTGHGVHLTVGSPCREGGRPAGDYHGQTDLDGEPRVCGAGVDMGADEWLDTDEDELPDFWEELHFGLPTAGDPLADEDGDLVMNLDEYRLGRDPHWAPLDLFVDVAGDDAWDGLAVEWNGTHGPKATIQAAINAAAPYEGDRISVAPGIYNEAIDFAGKAVALRSSDGPDVTTIEAAALETSVVTCSTGEGPDTILEGFTITGGSATYGGGMYNSGSSPTVSNCIFTENWARNSGGGMYNSGSSPRVNNCAFRGNSADYGGGMYSRTGSPTVVNCTFNGNASGLGGGMYNSSYSSPTVTNCTFSGNWASWCFGAIYNDQNSSLTVTNCILWDDAPEEIYDHPAAMTTITYTVLMDDDPDDDVVYPGTGNLDDDPLLTRDGAHLTADSPCRDSGNPGGDYAGQADLDGEPRVIGAGVDMGADEWMDTDGDGLPNFWEERHFGSPTAGDPLADDDGDLVVNFDEFAQGRDPHRAPVQFFVDVSGNDAWDGLAAAWDGEHGPKATIQATIDTAAPYEGDQISVGPGTYNEAIDFVGKAVALRSRDGPAATLIDASALDTSVVTCAAREGPDTVLGGFTISGGSASKGGGMYNFGSSPTVCNCTFSGNTASYGGGMCNRSDSRPTVSNCTFTRNSAACGGAMWNGTWDLYRLGCSVSAPTLTNCAFSGNIASDYGGAIYNFANSSPTIGNCTFQGNSADRGGGIHNLYCDPTVTNCTFTENSADYGGGVYNGYSTPTVTNCILWGNPPDEIYVSSNSTATVTYSSVMDDDPDDGVVWPGTGNLDDDPRFVREPDDGGDGWGDDPDTPEIDEGANDDYGDLHLRPGSPCIDAADNTAVPADTTDLDDDGDTEEPIPLDLAGHPRFVDDLATEDTGNPSAEVPDRIVDMGAYEAATAGDCNWDERVDLLEYYVFHACLTGPDPQVAPYCWMLDLDGSGEVDLADFAVFERQFTGSP